MSEHLPKELEGPLIKLWNSDQLIVAPMRPRDAFQAVAVIQFATRNPQISDVQRQAAIAVARVLQQAVTRLDPIVGKYLEMGWDPQYDTPKDDPPF